MHSEALYLVDIRDATAALGRFVKGRTLDDLITDELFASAVVLKLIIIGEAANKLSRELKARYPEVEWVQTIGMRNTVVHGYFAIRWPIIWETVSIHVPRLAVQVQEIIKAEYPEFA